jgi:transposase
MDRARLHEGVRRMRFADLLGRTERSELSQAEAAELLGVSERTFRRWRERYREAGSSGLADRRLQPSLRQAPKAEIARMLGLYGDLYRGFTVKHFHEQLGKRHGYRLGYTVTKLHLHRAGLVTPARSRSAHRKKRPRRPNGGHVAASGCLDACLAAGGRSPIRPGGDDGRCHERDLLAVPGGAGGHGIEPARHCRGARAGMACSVRSTPTVAATISRHPRQVVGCRRRC